MTAEERAQAILRESGVLKYNNRIIARPERMVKVMARAMEEHAAASLRREKTLIELLRDVIDLGGRYDHEWLEHVFKVCGASKEARVAGADEVLDHLFAKYGEIVTRIADDQAARARGEA